jgi:4-amino-4-deoxy-L-arabinose transferase-like glycosyltransferase
MVIAVNLLQERKALAGILCTLFPIVAVVNDVQPEKTGRLLLPIVAQLVALKFTDDSLVQFPKARSPIFVTELGMVMLVNLSQERKAWLGILCTLFPIVTEVSALQLEKTV